MNEVKRFIVELRQQGISIFLKDGKLKTQAKVAAISSLHASFIRENKEAIIQVLEEEQSYQFNYSAIPVVDNSQPMNLSFAQQRLWFIDQVEGKSEQYNITSALRFKGELNLLALEATLGEIMNRHSVLRTRYNNFSGEPKQEILDADFGLKPESIDYWQESDVVNIIEREAQTPFDLSTGPMFRARLLQLTPTDHVLVFSMHHIASDGWSIGILVKECVTLYQSYCTSAQTQSTSFGNVLDKLPVQYTDYASWHNEHLQGETFNKAMNYWQDKLSEVPTLHSLPLDRPRPEFQSYSGESIITQVRQTLTNQLRQLARQHDCTMFMLLQSAFALLIGRWSNRQDIVMGTPVSGRSHPQTENLIGFFVNSLVLRTTLDEQQSFSEMLAQNRKQILQDFEHQDVPFDLLVDKLQPKRNLSHTPLFQIMFEYANEREELTVLDNLSISAIDLSEQQVRFDLELSVTENRDDLEIRWRYADAIFEQQSINSMADSFICLLQNLVIAPDISSHQVSMLTHEYALKSTISSDDLVRPYPLNSNLSELFARQVKQSPNAIAIAENNTTLTYSELDRKSNVVAHKIIKLGVKPGEMVGLSVPGGLEHICVLLGIVKVGAAYVPIDSEYPSERIEAMIEDCEISLVIATDGAFINTPVHVSTVFLSEIYLNESMTNEGVLLEHNTLSPELSAYVMFTSGSTGKPKGVEISHKNIIRLAWQPNYAELSTDDVIANVSNTAFDASTFEVWGALLNGARAEVLDKQTLLSPESLKQVVVDKKITTMFITTAMFNQVARACPDAFSPLKTLLFGGEAVDNDSVARVLESGKPTCLNHVYGPTENCTFSTAFTIEQKLPCAYPIGQAINGTQCLIVDSYNQLVPDGAIGELLVVGDGIAKGYVKRPDLTARHFVNHSSSGELACYRTGDIVRKDSSGKIVFIARLDGQVKIRGFRVEPNEVVYQLNQLDGVEDSYALVTQDTNGENQLVAYIIPAHENEKTVNDIKAQLSLRVPTYMIPSAIVAVNHWPLNPNGKIDKKSLPKPSVESFEHFDFVTPKSADEQKMVEIFARLLKLDSDKLSATANFFELGGHSLLLVRLLAEIGEQWGQQISIKDAFSHPTSQGLVSLLNAGNAVKTLSAVKSVPFAEQGMPLSSAQSRLWFIDQVSPGGIQYNMPIALQITGQFDLSKAQSVLTTIIERHQVLRSYYIADTQGSPLQKLQNEFDFNIPIVDLTMLNSKEQAQCLHRKLHEVFSMPFNLSSDLMLRATYIKQTQDKGVLLFNMHHIASDGWSMGVLVEEFLQFYQANTSISSSDVALPIQYSDYANWQHENIVSGAFQVYEDYWQKQLADLPVLHHLPVVGERPAIKSSQAGQVVNVLPARLTLLLNETANQLQMTPFMLLHAAYSLVLSRYSNTFDVVVGTPVANRTSAELEPLIGFFVNMLVLRTNTDLETIEEYLDHVKTVNLEAQDAQAVSLDRIVELLKVERSMQYSPLFQVTISMDTNEHKSMSLPGADIELYEHQGNAVSKFDLELSIQSLDETMRLQWTYDSALFEHQQIEEISDSFIRVIEALLENPNGNVSDVNKCLGLQLESFMSERNCHYKPKSYDVSIAHQLQENADKRPDDVAVVFEQQTLTFSQLNARSNQLARVLCEKGVEPNCKVGIMLERSIEMIVSMFAVHKARAAFVPIDPNYPEQRVDFMLDDGRINHLLTQQVHCTKPVVNKVDHVFALDDANIRGDVSNYSVDNLDIACQPSDVAYVIYTSGSSGNPKGVEVEQRNLSSFLPCILDQLDELGTTPYSPWLWHTTYTFDAALKGLLLLGNGHKVILANEVQIQDPQKLMSLAISHDVEVVNASPQLMSVLLNSLPADSAWRPHLIIGGEQISGAFHQQLLAYCRDNNRKAINAYGPTEGTINASYGLISEQLTIGKPCVNTRVYILDKNLNPLPVGTPGELYIAGDGIARGYLNNPDTTADKFIQDPFYPQNQMMYRTGDVVKFMPSGDLAFIGRNDDQVKIRGFRVELDEVELALSSCATVDQVKVLNVKDNHGTEQLVAYIVSTKANTEQTAGYFQQLKFELTQTLPDYMIPTRFMLLENLPLTNSGKLNRAALKALKSESLGDSYVAPTTDVEKTLCLIWQELIGIERIGILDNFFQVGGHSLLAIRLASKIQDIYDFDVSLADLFDVQTVKSMAAFIEQEILLQQALNAVEMVDEEEESETLVI